MPGLDSRPDTSPRNDNKHSDQSENAEAEAAYARAMPHRQIIRRTLIAGSIVVIVGLATLVGIPVVKQLKTQWFLQAQGFSVDWQLDEDNWTNGGVTHVGFNRPVWFHNSVDTAIPALSGLMNLETLSLAECPVTEQGLQSLTGLVQLQDLDLTRLNFFRHGFRTSGVLPGPEGNLTDACVPPLLSLTRLRRLSLAGNRITDKGLEQIGKVTNLDELDLEATDVTDQGLIHLQSLRRLKNVNVAATQVTPEGIKALQKALPGVEISLDIDPVVEITVKAWRTRKP
jgi:hypothetical protein